VEAVEEDRPVKMTDKGAVGGEAEAAKAKTTEVSETATAKVSEAAAVAKPDRGCLRGVRDIGTRKWSRAGHGCGERQSGERKRRHAKLMLEHWTSPCVATMPAIRTVAGVTGNRCTRTE
jgi:hypothetical protein